MKTINIKTVSAIVIFNILVGLIWSWWWLILTIPISAYVLKKVCYYHRVNLHDVSQYPNELVYNSITRKMYSLHYMGRNNSIVTNLKQIHKVPLWFGNRKTINYFFALDLINIYQTKCKDKNGVMFALLLGLIYYSERKEGQPINLKFNDNDNCDKYLSARELHYLYEHNVNSTINRFDQILSDHNGSYNEYFLYSVANKVDPDLAIKLKSLYTYISNIFTSQVEYLKIYKEWNDRVNKIKTEVGSPELKFSHRIALATGYSRENWSDWYGIDNPFNPQEIETSIKQLESELSNSQSSSDEYDYDDNCDNDYDDNCDNNCDDDYDDNRDDDYDDNCDDDYDDNCDDDDSNDRDGDDFLTHTPHQTNYGKVNMSDIMKELDALVGLERAKEEVRTLINNVKVDNERKRRSLPTQGMSYHMIFHGNPGTGKTTVARIIAKAFKALGIISKGNLIEAHRDDFVAGYLGQTAIKTKKLMKSAKGNVLFIDEAYSLVKSDDDSFGHEAVDSIIAEMENNRDNMVVILAGYEREMSDFLSSNPGFKSRINRYISFEDYDADALTEIFIRNAKDRGLRLDEITKNVVHETMEKAERQKDSDFGNARFVRNLVEKSYEELNRRMSSKKIKSLSNKELSTLLPDDIRKAFDKVDC